MSLVVCGWVLYAVLAVRCLYSTAVLRFGLSLMCYSGVADSVLVTVATVLRVYASIQINCIRGYTVEWNQQNASKAVLPRVMLGFKRVTLLIFGVLSVLLVFGTRGMFLMVALKAVLYLSGEPW